jgi:hypothetical protein
MNQMRPSNEFLKFALLVFAVFLLSLATSAEADTFDSYTGTLSNPEATFQTTFNLATSTTVTFQTWGFGGGTNAAGTVIAAGGFDPMIALFSGSGATATMDTDGFGNPLADADNLFNPPWSYVGNCPPAGTVDIGGDLDCGDDLMQVALAAGTYTLVLSDANYIPDAVYDNGLLSEGFTDFTSGVFQTCDPATNTCITPTANYALDITFAGATVVATPEPPALSLLGIGLAALAGFTKFKTRRTPPRIGGNAI